MTKKTGLYHHDPAGAAHLCGALWRVSGAAACGGDHRSAGRLMGRNAPSEGEHLAGNQARPGFLPETVRGNWQQPAPEEGGGDLRIAICRNL